MNAQDVYESIFPLNVTAEELKAENDAKILKPTDKKIVIENLQDVKTYNITEFYPKTQLGATIIRKHDTKNLLRWNFFTFFKTIRTSQIIYINDIHIQYMKWKQIINILKSMKYPSTLIYRPYEYLWAEIPLQSKREKIAMDKDASQGLSFVPKNLISGNPIQYDMLYSLITQPLMGFYQISKLVLLVWIMVWVFSDYVEAIIFVVVGLSISRIVYVNLFFPQYVIWFMVCMIIYRYLYYNLSTYLMIFGIFMLNVLSNIVCWTFKTLKCRFYDPSIHDSLRINYLSGLVAGICSVVCFIFDFMVVLIYGLLVRKDSENTIKYCLDLIRYLLLFDLIKLLGIIFFMVDFKSMWKRKQLMVMDFCISTFMWFLIPLFSWSLLIDRTVVKYCQYLLFYDNEIN